MISGSVPRASVWETITTSCRHLAARFNFSLCDTIRNNGMRFNYPGRCNTQIRVLHFQTWLSNRSAIWGRGTNKKIKKRKIAFLPGGRRSYVRRNFFRVNWLVGFRMFLQKVGNALATLVRGSYMTHCRNCRKWTSDGAALGKQNASLNVPLHAKCDIRWGALAQGERATWDDYIVLTRNA